MKIFNLLIILWVSVNGGLTKCKGINQPVYGRFLHVTDIHVDENYVQGASIDSLCHRKGANLDPKVGKFGALKSKCDSPVDLVTESYKFMKSQFSSSIDFIIDTGDVVRHDRDKFMSRNKTNVLDDHTRIVSYYSNNFDLSKVQVIPTIGNNDEYEHDISFENSPLLKKLSVIWAPYRLNLENDKDFLKGGYFKVDMLGNNLTIISLNTVTWYGKNEKAKKCDENGLSKNQLTWLKKQLEKAENYSTKVYIIGHIPPNDEDGSHLYLKSCYESYIQLIGEYSQVILGQFNGHTNSDTLSVLVESSKSQSDKSYKLITLTKEKPAVAFNSKDIVGVLTNGPSIIPVHNPALRVYSYNPKANGLINGYTQYYADLKKANKGGKVEFVIEYESSIAYQLKNLSVDSWKKFIPKLTESDNLYELYSKYISVSTS